MYRSLHYLQENNGIGKTISHCVKTNLNSVRAVWYQIPINYKINTDITDGGTVCSNCYRQCWKSLCWCTGCIQCRRHNYFSNIWSMIRCCKIYFRSSSTGHVCCCILNSFWKYSFRLLSYIWWLRARSKSRYKGGWTILKMPFKLSIVNCVPREERISQ